MGAGGFLVLESNFVVGRNIVRWKGLLLLIGAVAAMAILSSCGTSATTTTPTITVSCVPTDITVLGTAQCTASVLNLSSTLVNWSVSGTGNGSITSAGAYTAPATVPTNNVVTITATSQVQASLTATQGVTIQAATAISSLACVDPNSSSSAAVTAVTSGNTLDCSASASTGAILPVTWSVTNATANLQGNAGSISPLGGVYAAPLIPPAGQVVKITATTANALSVMSVTVTVNFGNNVLNGNYVFSASGRLTNLSNAFWARVGRLSAGGGTLTGIEDTNQEGTPNTVTTQRPFTGSYSIGTDGRGTMQFCENANSSCPLGSTSATAFFRIAVVSTNLIQIIEFSSPSTSSAAITAGGEMLLQDALVLPNSANLSGTYSFNFSGVSSAATEESAVGEFNANGFGTIAMGSSSPAAAGEVDLNPGGTAALAATSYLIGSNGRGTVTLNGLNFSFYPVSASRVKFIEVDPIPPATTASILAGDAYKQQTSLNCGWGLSALSGPTLLETSGTSSAGVIADLGTFTVSGTSGNFTGASIDENNAGTVSSQVGALSGTYTLDPDSCGRGTLTIGTHSYVFYIISPSFAALQEITSGIVGHGLLLASQGGPFADSTLTGSYTFRVGGTNAAGTAGLREDFLGQFTSAGTGTGLAGTLDLNNYGAAQPGLAIMNGMYTAAGGLRGTLALPVATSPASTRNFVLYMVTPTLFYVLDTDTAGSALGAINNQF